MPTASSTGQQPEQQPTQGDEDDEDVPTFECSRDGCDEEFEEGEDVMGSFCSRVCWYQHKGAGPLRKIKHDHRWCASCFKPIKEVEPPSEEWQDCRTDKRALALDNGARFRANAAADADGQLVLDATACPDTVQPTAVDAVIGTQHPTEHTEWATDIKPHGEDNWRLDDDAAWREGHQARWSCQCGNVDPSTQEDALAQAEGGPVLIALLRLLWRLEAEGTIGQHASKDTLFDAFGARPGDWAYAIGRSLYA